MTALSTPSDVQALGDLDRTGLDDAFHAATVGDIPAGRGEGTALLAAGTRWSGLVAKVVRVAWRGKLFSPERRQLENLLTPWAVPAITAAVYRGESWLDGAPCIVLDYSSTSLSARWVRDEIREVSPGYFLGIVFLRHRQLPVHFTLRFDAG